MFKRNVLLGGLLAAALVTGSGVAAHAEAWNEGDSTLATSSNGKLSLVTQEYSMSTVYVKVDYSKFLYPDTVIDVAATDKATGKVVSTSRIDNGTWVRERVLGGFSYGHVYDFSATLSWKNGLSAPVQTSSAVVQKIEFTDQLRTMSFKTLNENIPVSSIEAGTVQRAKIEYSTKTDPKVFKLPSRPALKIATAGKSSRFITWAAANANGGFAIDSYKVQVIKGDKIIASKSIDADEVRNLKLNKLSKGTYKIVLKSTNISENFSATSGQFRV